jgi:hypothetical protein
MKSRVARILGNWISSNPEDFLLLDGKIFDRLITDASVNEADIRGGHFKVLVITLICSGWYDLHGGDPIGECQGEDD